MSPSSFQIRVCQNPGCGLRYPLVAGQPFGDRCPACLGETLPVLEAPLSREIALPEEASPNRGGPAVLLDNIRSAWNVGSILRSADGFGFSHAFLCGITPTPENAAVGKTALGATEFVTWSAHKDAVRLAAHLGQEGWQLWALEYAHRSIPISTASVSGAKIVLIVGNEITGVDPGLLAISDQIVHLPMSGQKRSFNVAVAFGAAAYQLSSMRDDVSPTP